MSTPKKVIIFGTGPFALLLNETLVYDKRFEVLAFAVDKAYIKETEINGREVIAWEDLSSRYPKKDVSIIVGVGYTGLNKNRENVYSKISAAGFTIESYIHPGAIILTQDIGRGVIALAGAVVEPFCKIEEGVVCWTNTTIAHHTIVKPFCWIAAGAVVSANSTVGLRSFVGINSTITNNIVVGADNFIGAGALVHKNTADEEVYLLQPAEKYRMKSSDFIRMTGL